MDAVRAGFIEIETPKFSKKVKLSPCYLPQPLVQKLQQATVN